MAAVTSNIAGRSEPFAPIAAIFLPVSGVVGDVKIAHDRNITGAVLNTTGGGGTGVWVITFANAFPALSNLIVDAVSENDGAASGDFFTNVEVTIAGAAVTIRIYAMNVSGGGVVTIPLRDNSTWVNIRKSVF